MITCKQKNTAPVQDLIWPDHIWLSADTISFYQSLILFSDYHFLTMARVASSAFFAFSKTTLSCKCDLILFLSANFLWCNQHIGCIGSKHYTQLYLLKSEQQIRETEQQCNDKPRYRVLQLSFSDCNSST